MKSIKAILMAGLVLAPAAANALTTVTVRCGLPHFVRAGGTELHSAAINFNNGDLTYPVTIERLTIRNFFGDVIHDSGPAVSVPHPLNTDFTSPVDITTVPPGAMYYLRTNHIWGNHPLPASAGGNEAGQGMSVAVQYSTDGKEELVVVAVGRRARERIVSETFTREGAERSRNTVECLQVDPLKEK